MRKFLLIISVLFYFGSFGQSPMHMLIAKKAASSGPTPLSKWLMNDGSGTTAVDAIGGRNLTLTNGPTWGTGSVVLDGINDYLIASSVNFGLDGGTEMTLAFYIKTTASAGRVIQKQIDDGDNTFLLLMNATGQLYFSIENAAMSMNPSWINTTPGDFSAFTHVAFAYKRNAFNVTDCVIYINKVAVSSGSTTFAAGGYASGFTLGEISSNLLMGARPVSINNFWAGELKDVRVYNKQLSAAEVAALP